MVAHVNSPADSSGKVTRDPGAAHYARFQAGRLEGDQLLDVEVKGARHFEREISFSRSPHEKITFTLERVATFNTSVTIQDGVRTRTFASYDVHTIAQDLLKAHYAQKDLARSEVMARLKEFPAECKEVLSKHPFKRTDERYRTSSEAYAIDNNDLQKQAVNVAAVRYANAINGGLSPRVSFIGRIDGISFEIANRFNPVSGKVELCTDFNSRGVRGWLGAQDSAPLAAALLENVAKVGVR